MKHFLFKYFVCSIRSIYISELSGGEKESYIKSELIGGGSP